MATETERLRQEITHTREDLARDVDRLAERANPGGIARRRMQRVKDGMRSLKDRVMGASEAAASTVGDAASDVGSTIGSTIRDAGSTVKDAPAKLASATKGSPVAVGLIAFGGGMLAAAYVIVRPRHTNAALSGMSWGTCTEW